MGPNLLQLDNQRHLVFTEGSSAVVACLKGKTELQIFGGLLFSYLIRGLSAACGKLIFAIEFSFRSILLSFVDILKQTLTFVENTDNDNK